MTFSSLNTNKLQPSPYIPSANFSNTSTGTYTSGVNYKYVTFTSNGSLIVTTAGYADVLIVGGGSSGGGEYASAGSGGSITTGSIYLTVGTHAVNIGAGGCCGGGTATGDAGQVGGSTQLGLYNSAAGRGYATAGWSAPYASSITGSSVTYGAANTGRPGTPANTGNGGIKADCCSGPPGGNGAAGVVIVRVVV